MRVLGSSLGALVMGLSLLAGCGRGMRHAKAAFEADFDCRDAVATATESRGRYVVDGCGRIATYVCADGYCGLQTSELVSPPTEDQPRRRRSAEPVAASPKLASGKDGSSVVLEIGLEHALLRLTGNPAKQQNPVQLSLIRAQSDEGTERCNLDFMINGQVLKVPTPTNSRKGTLLAQRIVLGPGLVDDFGSASKIALRSCGERWSLSGEQVEKIRDFIERYREEAAWNAPAREGGTGGMLPPSGGWPEWKASSIQVPATVSGAALEGSALFKKLSPSVFVLEATRPDGVALGSAVAIASTELLTNCHVLQGATKLILKQGKETWPAKVLRADPVSDRCTVGAAGASFTPVGGVRSYDSLEVGEAAYTLGSPVGLELTLSNGIISGRREEEGRRYVQTTAPISPGSSGGGLFDARGNLIGVTTLVLVGREHLNQSLNFAIPADAYFEAPVAKGSF